MHVAYVVLLEFDTYPDKDVFPVVRSSLFPADSRTTTIVNILKDYRHHFNCIQLSRCLLLLREGLNEPVVIE